MASSYRLVGILNMFDVIPEFVYPVFEYEGNFFIQDRTSVNQILSFELLMNDNLIKSIIPLNKFKLTYSDSKINFSDGDNVLIGFQISEDELFLGTFEEFKKYAKELQIEDEFMNVEIPYYIEEMNQRRLIKEENSCEWIFLFEQLQYVYKKILYLLISSI